jgi:hypothetical protein
VELAPDSIGEEVKAKIAALKEGGATLQGFASWRIASGRTRRFAVNGTGQAARRNSARVHHKAGKEAVVGLAVALQHNVCGGASSPHTRGRAEPGAGVWVLITSSVCRIWGFGCCIHWTPLILSFELVSQTRKVSLPIRERPQFERNRLTLVDYLLNSYSRFQTLTTFGEGAPLN